MPSDRRRLLWLVVALAVLAAATLWEVLGTVFFAVTVVYVAEPLYRRLRERGLPAWWASVATTLAVFALVLALVAPFVVVLYSRRADIVAVLTGLPETYVVDVAGLAVTLDVGRVLEGAADLLSDLAVGFAGQAVILAVKLTVFGFVVFALLLRKRQLGEALLAAVPAEGREVATALARRTRETLFAIYVLQAVTAVVTFVVALAIFWGFGYRIPVVLALLAGILQFLPVVGPTVVIAAVVAAELLAGNVEKAVLVGATAWTAVAWLPDLLVRPRLASMTADLPGSLYFVGFTGGLLTLGPIGIIAGPVVVGLLVEALSLLSAETAAVGRPAEG